MDKKTIGAGSFLFLKFVSDGQIFIKTYTEVLGVLRLKLIDI